MTDQADPDLTGLDPQARRFLAMAALGKGASDGSAAARRAAFDRLMRFAAAPKAEVAQEDRFIAMRGAALPVRLYVPLDAPDRGPGLIYCHGGGLVAGSLATHDALCRTLALEAHCRIVSIGYRLAPEHPFPGPICDALLATRLILRQAETFGLDEARIAIAGDSGGATLAAIIARILPKRLIAQVLLCPVLDATGAFPSRRRFAQGFLLDAAMMAQDLALYAPRRPLDDPLLSPVYAPRLANVPPAIIHTAGFDPLVDEGAAYAARLREAGVSVRYTCHASLVHHFYGLTTIIPAAAAAVQTIAAEIAQALGGASALRIREPV